MPFIPSCHSGQVSPVTFQNMILYNSLHSEYTHFIYIYSPLYLSISLSLFLFFPQVKLLLKAITAIKQIKHIKHIRHVNISDIYVTPQEEILDYCEMDPFEHRTGWGHRDDKGPVPWLHDGF